MKDKLFLVKAKKEDAGQANSIPGHPEYAFIAAVDENSWDMRHKESEEVVRVNRLNKGDFYEYEILEKE